MGETDFARGLMTHPSRFDVISQLDRWGPGADTSEVTLAEAQAYCWQLATTHYENFPVLSWAVPPRLRQHFANVYAFCRWADDLGDEAGSQQRSLKLLDWWRSELEQMYAGRATHPVFVALLQTVNEFGLPADPFHNLISAFVQDQTITRYETFAQLHDYCRRSADPVGRIVLSLAGNANTVNIDWSDSICTGLQLTNFWQDVGRDLDLGRVYLPEEDRQRFGYTDADLQSRRFTNEFRGLMAFQVDRARKFLLRGTPLVQQMPGRLKVDIAMIVRGGLSILDGIEAIDYDVWQHRPVIRKSRLCWWGLRTLVSGRF